MMDSEEYKLLIKTMSKNKLFSHLGSVPIHTNYKRGLKGIAVYALHFNETLPDPEEIEVSYQQSA